MATAGIAAGPSGAAAASGTGLEAGPGGRPPRAARPSPPVFRAPTPAAEPAPADAAAALRPGAGADVYSALQIGGEQAAHVRDILRIQRERVIELGQGLRGKTISLEDFRRQMRELGAETDANLVSVLGETKLAQWRAYQQSPADASVP